MIIPYKDDISSKFQLVNCVFPNLILNEHNAHFMTNRTILTTKNEFVDELNQILIERFPGDSIEYYIFYYAIDEKPESTRRIFEQFNSEWFASTWVDIEEKLCSNPST